MKTRKQKTESISELKDKVAKSKMVVFTTFARAGEKGLNVSKMRELKKGLKAVSSKYLVMKKTLTDRALKDAKIKNIDVFGFNGSLGVVFGDGDEAAIAKNLYLFSRANPSLKFFGSIFAKEFINADQFIQLAKLPSRNIMLGRAVSMIGYPLSGLTNVLRANIRNLVLVLANIKKN